MAVDAERGLFLPSPPSNTRLWVLHTLRTHTRALVTATLASTLLLTGFLYASDAPRAALDFVSTSWSTEVVKTEPWPTQCSPEDFSDGTWQRKPPGIYPLEHFLSLYPYNASDPPAEPFKPTPDVSLDPLAPLGFSGCASGRERTWHLGMEEDGTPDRNHPETWGYVVRGASYDWVPKSDKCRRYNERVAAGEFVQSLVERGGWFLVGDSVTEQHFFSLSCLLHPHVRATPDYGPTGGSGPRDWPQHLYLDPTSPLVSQLRAPTGFDITRTPLVTFRRVDLLFNETELDAIHHSIHNTSTFNDTDPDAVPSTLFGPTASVSFNLSPEAYLAQFTAPLPDGNYRAMIVSTAGHWTGGSLPGAREVENVSAGATNPAVYKTFVEAVRVWTEQVAEALQSDSSGQHQGLKNSDREVFVRAYLPGHEYDCHQEPGPIDEVRPFSKEWYNWSWIGRMNEAFKAVITTSGDSRIRFLGLDRMALLRPDAHALSDCLHIQVGAGIFEGWSRYIWHFGDDTRAGRA